MKFSKDDYQKVDLPKVLDSYRIRHTHYMGQKGREYQFCCPFPGHDDSTPSFSINEESGIYHCFVCGGGDFVKFVQLLEKLQSRQEAIVLLKERLGIVETEESQSIDYFGRVRNSLENFINEVEEEQKEKIEIKEMPLPESEPAEKHFDIVKSRVDLDTIKKYRMRYCVKDTVYRGKADGRLIIPVFFEGKIVTFGARDMLLRSEKWAKIKDEAKARNASKDEIEDLRLKYEYKKYWYPFGTPMTYIFFNWDEALKNKEYVIVCEGILDAIRIAKFGYNVVASLSSNLPDHKANLLIKNFDTIFICLDNDHKVKSDGSIQNAGQKAAIKIINNKLDGANVFNILLPENKDPDRCSQQEFEECYRRSMQFKKSFTLGIK